MFSREIFDTPLTRDSVDGFFNNITSGTHEMFNDNTLLATARALLYPRIGDNKLQTITRTLPRDYQNMSVVDFTGNLRGVRFKDELAVISNTTANGIDDIKSWFMERYHGYREVEKIRAYYSKSFECCCLVNNETKSSVVFVDNLGIREYHFLQLSILVMLPWYFEDKKLSPLELRLINSLNQTEHKVYLDCLEEYYKEFNLREYKMRYLLKDIESGIERAQVERVKIEINEIMLELNQLNNIIKDKISLKREKDTQLLGLEEKIKQTASGDSNILSYFLCNDSVDLIDATESFVDFVVLTDIEYFEQEVAESFINNRNSIVYNTDGKSYEGEEADSMSNLLSEIFLTDNPRLKIKVCAGFRLNIAGTIQILNNCYENYPNYTPNPHLYHYSCLGDNAYQINTFLSHNDYIGAIEQCVAAAKNLNWKDGAVINSFMAQMWKLQDSYVRIELPDGRIVDQVDAIAWLEENKEEE